MASILEYDSYRHFLKDELEERKRRNPTYSLRAFAKFLDISPSHLSRAISGRKRLSAASARQVSTALDHSAHEADHFSMLTELDSASTTEVRTRILKRMTKFTNARPRILSMELFRAVSEWHHFAILALSNTKGFRDDSHWIARRLGIKPLEARLAVERLLHLKLLERTPKGLRAFSDANISTEDDLASSAIQENHLQHLVKSANALKELEVELREFQNVALSMNLSEVPKAKKMIRSFIDRMQRDLESQPSQEVFQLNVQFYQLTKSEKGRA